MQARAGWRAAGLAALSLLFAKNALAGGEVRGDAVFRTHCVACHQSAGEGAPGLAPPLASKQIAKIASKNSAYLALVVLNGLSGRISMENAGETNGVMPPVGTSLSDAEVAVVVTYIVKSLNGGDGNLDTLDVAKLREQTKTAKDLRTMRVELLQ